jgi:hypothetical protein
VPAVADGAWVPVSSQQSTGRLRDGGRAAVFSALRALPAFAGLVRDDLRVVSPGHGIDSGWFAADHFAAWINEGAPLPREHDDGALAAPNDGVTGPVAAALGAGFNRGACQNPAPTSLRLTLTPF